MKTYTFDYTLPAEAEKMAHQAFLMCQDEEMKKLLEETVMKLRQFLAQDNMVEDEDCEDWYVGAFKSIFHAAQVQLGRPGGSRKR